jgi:DNA polymerase/3'-5' exonuclease PolX
MLKNKIMSNLNLLKLEYEKDPSKKWNLKALKTAIVEIAKYDKEIISGEQLKNDINGIGDKISKRIDEIIKTGTLKELSLNTNIISNLNQEFVNPFLDITGVGDVRANKWYHELGLKTMDDLKNAIKNNIVKTTHHIDLGIKYYNDFREMIPRTEIDTVKKIISSLLKKMNKNYLFEICGSYRRGAKVSGDIDILITIKNEIIDNKIKKDNNENHLQNIVKELKKVGLITDELTINGNTKFMGVCLINKVSRRIDIRFIDIKNYYTALIYFTGNKNFNINIRRKALEKGMSLNEYGIKSEKNNILIKSEEDVFKILGIDYVEPENRNY